ncbi:MAG: hypothetical protein EA424_13605 [Planctomycetaceae bacterium]|nr:MAG: hypothetical protein EA424_13605 [Planctomycetaceae bacterium]
MRFMEPRQQDTIHLERDNVLNTVPATPASKPQQQTASVGDAATPNRQGTQGFSMKRLDLVFETDLPDDRFLDLIRQNGCEVVALKVRDDVILDAFLPGQTEILRRVRGQNADDLVNQYRTERPLNRHLWIRWHDAQTPIGRQAILQLERYGVSPTDYFVYIVLGDRLSQQIQRQVMLEAQIQHIPPDNIGYVKISLSLSGSILVPSVISMQPHQEPGDRDSVLTDTSSYDTQLPTTTGSTTVLDAEVSEGAQSVNRQEVNRHDSTDVAQPIGGNGT